MRAFQAVGFELLAFLNMLRPVHGNSYKKKLTLTVLMAVWLSFEFGMFFLGLDAPSSIWYVRALALYVIGRAHGVERARIDYLRGEK